MKIKLLGSAIAAAAISVTTMMAPTHAYSADFKCSTAKLIVPWGAGGGTSVIFNIFENIINNELKADPKIQVVTIPGQCGNKGAKEAKKAKPV